MPKDAPVIRLPDFIGVGPTRTGSTWLHGLLMQRACLPAAIKETWFFDRYYAKGPEWYTRHFSHCGAGARIGEVCPTYFAGDLARERIARDLPRCKIVCVLRDPVDRAYSWYRMQHRMGAIRGSFQEVIATNSDPQLHVANHYATRLQEWRASIGAESVAVFFYDDLFNNPQAFADSITAFLELAPITITPELTRHLVRNEAVRDCRSANLAYTAHRARRWLWAHHRGRLVNQLDRYGLWRFCFSNGPDFPPIEPEAAAALRQSYLPQIEALEKLCDRDLSSWKSDCRVATCASALQR